MERTPGDNRTIERPSAVGRTYHDAWTPLSLRASYHVRGQYRDDEMTGYYDRVRNGQELNKRRVEFKTQEEVGSNRGDRFVGRGPLLHHFGSARWHVADMRGLI